MMQIIRRKEIIVFFLNYTSSSTVPPASFEFAIVVVSLMLELTITSARQWSPDIAANGVDCLTDITTPHKKAPRAPNLLQCQRPDFSERAFSRCLRHPTNGKKPASGACWFEFWFSVTVCEGVLRTIVSAYNDVITMISGFSRPLSVPSDHASISRTLYVDYWISTIFYSGFFSARRLISEPIESVPM